MDVHLTKFQKLMLINAHPVKMIFNSIGGIIALYFIWKHELLLALVIGGAFILSGTALGVMNKIPDAVIAKSLLGRIFLRYSTIWGFICYSLSHVLIPLSFWYHSIYLTIAGAFFLLVGLFRVKGSSAN